MLRLTLLSAAIYGVNAGSHSGNASNATAAPTTAAATTAAATTAAATTAAPTTKAAVVNATKAATTVAATKAATTVAAAKATTTTAAPKKATTTTTAAPKAEVTTKAATADPRAGCGNDTTSANCTTTAAPKIAEKVVTTQVKVTLKMDLTGFTETEKTATGNGIAFGIHDSACDGVEEMWTTKGKCLTGVSKVDGISFKMAMNIAKELMAASPGCTAADCYGEAAPARVLAEVELENAGDFGVAISGAALKDKTTDYAAVATTAIAKAKTTGALSPASMQGALTKAFNRTSVTSAISADKLTTMKAAAAKATVAVTDPVVAIVTEAPTTAVAGTSGAYTAGAASALALIAGVFLF